MIPPNIELRLRDLEDNIKQDWELLREYEEALRYEDEPRRKAKYNREINNLRESANRYQKEYDELKTQIHGESSPQMQNVAIQLQQINTSLDKLYAGQKAIYVNINHLRQGLIVRYNEGEKNIIAAITDKMDETQISTISAVLDAIEADTLPEGEMQNILQGVQSSLATLQQQGTALSPNQKELAEIIKAPDLDTKHRLKLALPIIPGILSYEGEFEFVVGIDLKASWQALVARFQGE